MFKSINDFGKAKANQSKITMITAYDAFTGKVALDSGIDAILIGDSLGMVCQGKSSTLSLSIDEMIYHANCVSTGAPEAFIIVDMPYMSYHISPQNTVYNAGQIIKNTQAKAIKIEINSLSLIDHMKALLDAQIPVMAHIGLTPQSVNLIGGYAVQGREIDSAKSLCDFAEKIESAGAFSVVLECIPGNLAQQITDKLKIPTIGIGAGINCDGQILVINDMLGMSQKNPKFVKQYLNGYQLFTQAIEQYVRDVQNHNFPEQKHTFGSRHNGNN